MVLASEARSRDARVDAMRRWVKVCVSVVVTALLAPIVGLLAYDVLVFQPRQSEIQALLDRARPDDRNPPALIRRYILVAHRDGAPPAAHVARLLLTRFDLPREKGMLRWHATSAVWTYLVSLHMSQEQILAVYSALSFNGEGYGISALSQRLYSKAPSALSESEAAMVVAVLWAPSFYAADKSRLERRRDALLARNRAEHNGASTSAP